MRQPSGSGSRSLRIAGAGAREHCSLRLVEPLWVGGCPASPPPPVAAPLRFTALRAPLRGDVPHEGRFARPMALPLAIPFVFAQESRSLAGARDDSATWNGEKRSGPDVSPPSKGICHPSKARAILSAPCHPE